MGPRFGAFSPQYLGKHCTCKGKFPLNRNFKKCSVPTIKLSDEHQSKSVWFVAVLLVNSSCYFIMVILATMCWGKALVDKRSANNGRGRKGSEKGR